MIHHIAGAIIKEKYLELIKNAGFQDVKVIGEARFPINFMIDDFSAKTLIEELGSSIEEAKEYADLVASITVYGIKPDKQKPC